MESNVEHFGVTIQDIIRKGDSIIRTVEDVVKNDVVKKILLIPKDIKVATDGVTQITDDIKGYGDKIVDFGE